MNQTIVFMAFLIFSFPIFAENRYVKPEASKSYSILLKAHSIYQKRLLEKAEVLLDRRNKFCAKIKPYLFEIHAHHGEIKKILHLFYKKRAVEWSSKDISNKTVIGYSLISQYTQVERMYIELHFAPRLISSAFSQFGNKPSDFLSKVKIAEKFDLDTVYDAQLDFIRYAQALINLFDAYHPDIFVANGAEQPGFPRKSIITEKKISKLYLKVLSGYYQKLIVLLSDPKNYTHVTHEERLLAREGLTFLLEILQPLQLLLYEAHQICLLIAELKDLNTSDKLHEFMIKYYQTHTSKKD